MLQGEWGLVRHGDECRRYWGCHWPHQPTVLPLTPSSPSQTHMHRNLPSWFGTVNTLRMKWVIVPLISGKMKRIASIPIIPLVHIAYLLPEKQRGFRVNHWNYPPPCTERVYIINNTEGRSEIIENLIFPDKYLDKLPSCCLTCIVYWVAVRVEWARKTDLGGEYEPQNGNPSTLQH